MTALDELWVTQGCLLTDDMTERPFRFDDLGLVALPTAVPVARLFVQYVLSNWHAPASAVADATIIAGEIVTLSVRDAKQLTELRVRLMAYQRYVAIEVWDAATEVIQANDDVQEQPQGIDLVDILARRWTSRIYQQTRITWASVGVYDETPSGLPIRPQRRASQRPVPQPLNEELLRRVRDGLKGL